MQWVGFDSQATKLILKVLLFEFLTTLNESKEEEVKEGLTKKTIIQEEEEMMMEDEDKMILTEKDGTEMIIMNLGITETNLPPPVVLSSIRPSSTTLPPFRTIISLRESILTLLVSLIPFYLITLQIQKSSTLLLTL